MAAGLTNSQIGQRLFLSPKTVANNITTVLDKLHVANRVQAIVKGREAGLGRSDPEEHTSLGAQSSGRSGARKLSVNFRFRSRACHSSRVSSRQLVSSVRKTFSITAAKSGSMTSRLIS